MERTRILARSVRRSLGATISTTVASVCLLFLPGPALARVEIELLSGSQPGSGPVETDAQSRDSPSEGSATIFRTAERLVAEDQDDNIDVYLRDGDTTRLVSRRMPGATADDGVSDMHHGPLNPAILRGQLDPYTTPSGSQILFFSYEGLVPEDADGMADVYEYSDGSVRLVSRGITTRDAFPLTINAAGTRIGYLSDPPTGTRGTRQYHVEENGTATSTWTGLPNACSATPCDYAADWRAVSPDGRWTLLQSNRPEGETGPRGPFHCLLVDSATGAVRFSPSGGFGLYCHSVSNSGQVTLWTSAAIDAEADTNDQMDLYRWDPATNQSKLISQSNYGSGPVAIGTLWDRMPMTSADGAHALFIQGNASEVTIYEEGNPRASAVATRAHYLYARSADANAVIYGTWRRDSPDDQNDSYDLYRATNGSKTLLSNEAAGLPNPSGGFGSMATSDGGERVSFVTDKRLVPEDTDDTGDVYQWEAGQATLLSGQAPSGGPPYPHVGDGIEQRRDLASTVFTTDARLSSSDTDNALDIYRARVVADPPPPDDDPPPPDDDPPPSDDDPPPPDDAGTPAPPSFSAGGSAPPALTSPFTQTAPSGGPLFTAEQRTPKTQPPRASRVRITRASVSYARGGGAWLTMALSRPGRVRLRVEHLPRGRKGSGRTRLKRVTRAGRRSKVFLSRRVLRSRGWHRARLTVVSGFGAGASKTIIFRVQR